jgi:glutamate N-acetyltransferase/amino-acid N-acetyltransferase
MTNSANQSKTASHSTNALPGGFRFAGVTCGIKASGKHDLSLIVCDQPASGAGVYTQNQIVAAPVILCRSRTPSSSIRAIVTNSGNANACTGQAGLDNATSMCNQVAQLVGCQPAEVLVMSTGVIGKPLPMDKVGSGIAKAHAQLGSTMESFLLAADAICTTDQYRKIVFREVLLGNQVYRIAAMAKGAGMIAPNMATMLGVVLTDAPLTSNAASIALTRGADKSFNRISVDGHTSTNDTLLLLASGRGEPMSGDLLQTFQRELESALIELAKLIVADGEGATHVLSIHVEGAGSDRDAQLIAKTVAASPLVKTAIAGGDPNWGRIVSAAGYAEAKIQPELTCLRVCGQSIYHLGSPLAFDAGTLSGMMKQSPEVLIELRVGDGPGTASYWSSDLTTDYVRFNSEYTT